MVPNISRVKLAKCSRWKCSGIQKMKTSQGILFYASVVVGALTYLVICIHAQISQKELNNFPVIGIVAQDLNRTSFERKFPAYSSYISASYVKAVESSGARVVPIVVNKNETYYRNILKSINGVVLPGGASWNEPGHPYYDTIATIYRIANEMNENGNPFPILGVCLGYEFLITVANQDKNILMKCNIDYDNYPLEFVEPYNESSLFSKLTQRQYELLKTDITVNHHMWCALPDTFNDQPLLKKNWKITSFSTTPGGLKFIASVEHVTYPYFGVQFHPEKIAFEWFKHHKYPHSEEALYANRYFYDIFIHYARRNYNKFEESELANYWIYNYPATSTAHLQDYMQIYLF